MNESDAPPGISRREFLKLSGFSLGAFAFGGLFPRGKPLPPELPPSAHLRGRVTKDMIYAYTEPDIHSPRLGVLRRDELVELYEALTSSHGLPGNPRWYRLEDGYAHSAYLQRVERAHANPVLNAIPEGGQLGQITYPIVQSLRRTQTGKWEPLYRLYYDSVFWITSLEDGPDGKPWYGLTDDRLRIQYYVPARAVRPIPPAELTAINPEVPEEEKRLEVSLKNQRMQAFEGQELVYDAAISSGSFPGGTPRGAYRLQVKRPSRHMGDGRLTTDLQAYELPGVPWVSYFTAEGVAFHGAYWHDNFGSPISHGCINLRNPDAQWVYRWSAPAAGASEWQVMRTGTRVLVE